MNKTRLAPVLSGVGVLLAAVIINASVGSSLGMAAGLLALSLNYLMEIGAFNHNYEKDPKVAEIIRKAIVLMFPASVALGITSVVSALVNLF